VSRKGLEMSRIILTDSRVDVNIPEISLLSGKEIQNTSSYGLVASGVCGDFTPPSLLGNQQHRENTDAPAQRGCVKWCKDLVAIQNLQRTWIGEVNRPRLFKGSKRSLNQNLL